MKTMKPIGAGEAYAKSIQPNDPGLAAAQRRLQAFAAVIRRTNPPAASSIFRLIFSDLLN